MHVSQPILAASCLYPKPEEENPPIFKNGEALKNTPRVSVKARFESQLNPLFAPALFTSTGARRLSSFTTRKSHIINFRLITTTTLPPTTIIEHFLKMPKGTNKNEILSSLAHHEGLDAVSKVKCIFAMSKPKPALGQNPAELFNLKDYFIKETFADTINAFAQNSTLDPDFRAQCIRHMTDKKQQPLLAKDLLKQEPSCSKKLLVKLVYVLQPGKFKNETLKRLS